MVAVLRPGDVALLDPSTGRELLLIDAGGWTVRELDLGHPTVREVIDPAPLTDGARDRTLFFGARAVGAVVAGYNQDMVAARDLLAGWHHPGSRPVLRFRSLYGEARRMNVRPNSLDATLESPALLKASLSWVCPSGVSEADTATVITLRYAAGNIRTPLGNADPDLNEPIGGTSWPLTVLGGTNATATVSVPGNTPCWWSAAIGGQVDDPALLVDGKILLKIKGRVPSGTTLYVDGAAHTIVDQTGAAWYDKVDWAASSWSPLSPGDHVLSLTGTPLTGASVTMTFRGAWL